MDNVPGTVDADIENDALVISRLVGGAWEKQVDNKRPAMSYCERKVQTVSAISQNLNYCTHGRNRLIGKRCPMNLNSYTKSKWEQSPVFKIRIRRNGNG